MAIEATAEERLRAAITAQWGMVRALWVFVLQDKSEWREELAALKALTLRDLEELLSQARGRDAEFTQHLAIAHMEDLWKLIAAELASHEEPIPYLPTALGRNRPGISPEALPPDEPDDTPDQ